MALQEGTSSEIASPAPVGDFTRRELPSPGSSLGAVKALATGHWLAKHNSEPLILSESSLERIPSMSSRKNPITIPTIEDLTRRELLSSALAAALLISCGGDADEAPEATTRTIDTPMGPVEVPVSPQRIVALDPYSCLQVLDELGAPLVAAGALGGGSRTLVSDAAQTLPVIGITTEIDLEAVVAASPDLIIGEQQMGEEIYSQLSEIAPTVLVSVSGGDWRDIYRTIASAAGIAGRVEEPLAGLTQRVAELETEIANAWPDGVSLTVLRVTQANFTDVRIYTSFAGDFIASSLLHELQEVVTVTGDGLAGADGATNNVVNVRVSTEKLRDADADIILYYLGGGGEADVAPIEQALTGHPLWRSLNAVQAGRAHRVDAAAWFQGRNLAAANLILDDLFEFLT